MFHAFLHTVLNVKKLGPISDRANTLSTSISVLNMNVKNKTVQPQAYTD